MKVHGREWHLLHRQHATRWDLNPATLRFYSPLLEALAHEGRESLREQWEDEAAAAALDGNPTKAHYIESHWIGRLP